jgi:hypothetical protein
MVDGKSELVVMVDGKSELVIFAILIITLTLMLAPMALHSVFAIKSISSAKTSTKVHLRGVKVLRIHTVPSKVTAGSTFGLRGVVVNNSTATITFANGTCTSPLTVTFNKNAISEPQTKTASCKAQLVTLKPGGQSPILVSSLSGIAYKATSPGTTNATLIFKYGVITSTSKTPIGDSISRVYTFNILPTGTTPTPTPATTHSPTAQSSRSTPSSQPGVLKAIP